MSLFSPIGGRWLGVDFLTPVTYTHSSGGVFGSFLWASAPLDVAVRVRLWNAWKPARYVITVWSESDVNWDAGRLRVRAVGMDPHLEANGSVVWTTSGRDGIWKKREIGVSVWTTQEEWNVFQFNATTGGTWSAELLWNGDNHTAHAHVELKANEWRGNVSYQTTDVETSDSLLSPHNFTMKGHGKADGRTKRGADIALWTDEGQKRHQSHWIVTHDSTFWWKVQGQWGTSSHVDLGLFLPFPAESCKYSIEFVCQLTFLIESLCSSHVSRFRAAYSHIRSFQVRFSC